MNVFNLLQLVWVKNWKYNHVSTYLNQKYKNGSPTYIKNFPAWPLRRQISNM